MSRVVPLQQRNSQRRRSLIGAQIISNNGFSTLDCLVRDMSDTGARLKVENSVTIPEQFSLTLSDGRSFMATVRWRRVDTIGVSFDV